ncbi:hypothetical protein ACTXL6_16600 [Brachybacterium tyrofermentans]|uniref:hypothetical protein n=1 Tax=Brachybacterium tyrofermentans TaxID=47848 RepID=UPI003FD547D2
MFTPATILLVIGLSLLLAAGLAMYRASGSRTVDIPLWPAAATFALAMVTLGAAALTA